MAPRRQRRPPARDITAETPIWCPGCSQMKVAADFNRESRRFSGLSNRCRECQKRSRLDPVERVKTRARNQRRWADDGYRARSLEWQRRRRERLGTTYDLTKARRRLQAIVDEWKRANPCMDCGFSDIRALDPDHRDPATKSGHVSRMVQMTCSEERLHAELDKCESRCARCHRLRTKEQRPNSWLDGRRLPPSWARRLENQRRNDVLKLRRGCCDCGWAQDARGLDWDHVGFKGANISALIANNRTWDEIEAEIALCDCRCANCHRIKTLERLRAT